MEQLRGGFARSRTRARTRTTNEVPAERLVIEQAALQALPAPYRGRSALHGADDKIMQNAIGLDAGGKPLDGFAVDLPARVRGGSFNTDSETDCIMV